MVSDTKAPTCKKERIVVPELVKYLLVVTQLIVTEAAAAMV
jgi:hypothetical protein